MKTVAVVMVVAAFGVCGLLLWAAMTVHGVYRDSDDW